MKKILTKATQEQIVERCVDCPNVIGGWSGQGLCCDKDKLERSINEYISKDTLPEWCPLEIKE